MEVRHKIKPLGFVSLGLRCFRISTFKHCILLTQAVIFDYGNNFDYAIKIKFLE